MHKLDVLHFAAVTTLALSTSLAGAVPAQAQALSIRQLDEISEFVKCETYLLKGALPSFEADSDCGHGPVAPELKSLASDKGTGTPQKECPTDTIQLLSENGGEHCPDIPE